MKKTFPAEKRVSKDKNPHQWFFFFFFYKTFVDQGIRIEYLYVCTLQLLTCMCNKHIDSQMLHQPSATTKKERVGEDTKGHLHSLLDNVTSLCGRGFGPIQVQSLQLNIKKDLYTFIVSRSMILGRKKKGPAIKEVIAKNSTLLWGWISKALPYFEDGYQQLYSTLSMDISRAFLSLSSFTRNKDTTYWVYLMNDDDTKTRLFLHSWPAFHLLFVDGAEVENNAFLWPPFFFRRG